MANTEHNECMAQDLRAALLLALPHVERVASFAPTTNANMGKVIKARCDLEAIRAALARATQPAA